MSADHKWEQLSLFTDEELGIDTQTLPMAKKCCEECTCEQSSQS
jgi:hypothetical protein